MDSFAAFGQLDLQKYALVIVVSIQAFVLVVLLLIALARLRRSKRQAVDTRLLVDVLVPLAASEDERTDRWEDPLDDALSATGAGELYDGRSVTTDGTEQMELVVRLNQGADGLPALKTALLAAGLIVLASLAGTRNLPREPFADDTAPA